MGPKPSLPSQNSMFFLMIIIFSNHTMISWSQLNDDELEITISIGAIIDTGGRVGKEAKVAMEIAQNNFNNRSTQHKLSIHFNDTKDDPLQPAYTAEELIREKDVQALIISTETWDETALVADIGNRDKVPVISVTSSAISQPLEQLQWPYLVQMSSNFSQQIKCVASIIGSFKWRNVIAIYELDRYGGDSGTFAAFSEELQEIGVNIEHRLVLPAFDSFSYPNTFIHQQVKDLESRSSRVFVILQSSISLVTHLLREANDVGLMYQDSTWIVMEDIASQLHSLNPSLNSLMEGFLGITTYHPEENVSFLNFRRQFREAFRSEFPDENNVDMGIYALRAHDSVVAIASAATKNKLSTGLNSTSENTLLNTILLNNFTGLSGDIQFDNGELSQPTVYKILNIRKNNSINNYSIGFWSSEMGFSKTISNASDVHTHNMDVLAGLVEWPGDLKSEIPKGWSMPSDARRLQIGVPGRTAFDKFVYVDWSNHSNSGQYTITGFCIDVFLEVKEILEKSYPLPFEFIPYNGTYDDLVDQVANKTYDAVIGDVTILADRLEHVEFTQPFIESGLVMVVPKNHDKSWIFLRPFTKEMWAVTFAILIYNVFIVWLLERHSNPEFGGTWQDQLSLAVWFTFSSVFFAQREQVRSNYTRVVVVVWLFVVLILTTSYTASLSSLLTVNRLQPNVTDVKWLKDNNALIGCDGDSFVWRYLQDVLEFKPENIKNVTSEYDYIGEFESKNISAAFLESPYEKVFINRYCKGYTVPESTTNKGDRFGGLGFVFEKGSPIARDASEAILTLSENGTIKQLHQKWFSPYPSCRGAENDYDNDSLNWKSFWGLFFFSAATSTICYLTFLARKLYERYRQRRGRKIIYLLYRNSRRKLAELLTSFSTAREPPAAESRKPADTNLSRAEGRIFDQIELTIPEPD